MLIGLILRIISIRMHKIPLMLSKVMLSKFLMKIKRIGMLSKSNGIALSQQSLKNGKSRQTA